MAQLYFSDPEVRRDLADVDHDHIAADTQGEAYGGLGDDKDMSFNPPPPSDGEPPVPVHHQRNDPLTAGKPSPVASTGFEPFEAKPEDVGGVFPPARGYGNFEGKQEEAARAVPSSGYGGQPDEVPMLKDEGYTSLGIGESQGSENSIGVLSEEGNNSVKQRESSAPYESVAKELEDHFAGGGGIPADMPPLKKDPLDFPEGHRDDRREREAAPQGSLGNAERQQEDREAGPQGSFGNALQEHEEREGVPPEALGLNKDEPVEREGGVPYQAAMAEEPEGGSSATGSRGIIDVQALKGANVDLSETSSQEPNVVDDATEGDSKDESEADDPSSEARHADTSHFTSQIKSPVDDPKQRYAVDDPIQDFSVDDTKQEFPRSDSSKQEDFSELSQEPRADDPRKEEVSISDPKPECPVDLQQGDSLDDFNQEDSLDDVKKSPVDPIHEDSIAGPTHATDEMGEREAAPQVGLLGNVEQQENQRKGSPQRSFENSQDQGERDVTPLGALETSKDEQREREGAAPHQSAFAEEPESGSATGSRGVIDVQSLKEDYVDFSEASPNEPNAADDPMGDNSIDEPIPRQSAIAAEEPEGGFAPGSKGIINVDLSEASTKEPKLVEDSMEGNSTSEPTPHQSAMAEEPEGDSAQGSRGIIDVQSLKEDHLDLSEADTKEPIPADDSMEGSITNEPTSHQSVLAKEPEGGSATESRGIMDVQSLKEDYVDLSEASTKEPNVEDESLGGNSLSATTEEPEGGSAEGSRGIIDVQSMKEDYVDLSEAATSEPNSVEEAKGSSTNEPKVDNSLTDLEQKSPVDDADHEESNAGGPIPASSLDDSNAVQDSIVESPTVDDRELKLAEVAKPEQSRQPQATNDDTHGCERFQGDDGKEKIKAEGYNIYSGEPENKVYDAVDVIGGEDEKPTHDTEADVAVKPCEEDLTAKGEALPEALGNREDVPNESGSDIQGNEQARDFDTREDHDEHAEPFTQHVSSAAVEQDAGLKQDDRDDNTADVSTREETKNVLADEKALEFPAADLEQDESAVVDAKPEFALDDAKQTNQAEARSTGDEIDGCEHFQGDDGREKIKAEGYNIYSGEPEKTVYDVADVIGDQHEKLPHETEETEADAATKPCEDEETKDKAVTGVGDMEGDVLKKGSGFDIQGNEQGRDLDTTKEQDEHVEPVAQHVSPAVEQEAGFKPDARDSDIEDASKREDVPADKKSPYTDVFKIESSDIQQGLGFEADLKEGEGSPAVINKEVDAADREKGESGPAGEEFPNTEFAHTDDYVKVGHGAESSVPTQNEEVDGDLRAPSERVGQQEERRPTDEHPLDKPLERDVAEQEETYKIEVPKRSPSLPHPQDEDMAAAMNNKTGGIGEDEQQHHEAGPQKKGIFAKIKEKLSPTFGSH